MPLTDSIIDVPGIQVGHAQDYKGLTGCTVVICENGAVAGIDQRGGAPGTRETDLLRPYHLVQKVHTILLTGGSAFGLDAATGVMRWLEEKKIGVDTRVARIPIVPSAVLYDLDIGNPAIRPDAEMGYQACKNASIQPPTTGNVGAGTGARVGMVLGIGQAMKSGIGTASIEIGKGVIVAAIVAVNAFGDIYNPKSGEIIAGARTIKQGPVKIGEAGYFANTLQVMKTLVGRTILNSAMRTQTTIGVVATNAKLTKEEANKVAQMAQNGLARTIKPCHTMLDGDTLFCLSLGKKNVDVNIIGAYAAEVVEEAVIQAVCHAHEAGGLPSAVVTQCL